MASAIPSQSDLDSDSGSDCEEFKRARDRIKYVKEKLEREEFLKVYSSYTYETLLCKLSHMNRASQLRNSKMLLLRKERLQLTR